MTFVVMTLALSLAGLAPPTDIRAVDRPNDGGKAIRVSWTRSEDPDVASFRVLRQAEGQEDWEPVGIAGRLINSFTDGRAPASRHGWCWCGRTGDG
ncbi:MAG: hypothetical protein R6X12_00425 [bacterium]